MQRAAADGGEGLPRRRRGLTIEVIAPAQRRAVSPQGAGVIPASGDGGEGQTGRRRTYPGRRHYFDMHLFHRPALLIRRPAGARVPRAIGVLVLTYPPPNSHREFPCPLRRDTQPQSPVRRHRPRCIVRLHQKVISGELLRIVLITINSRTRLVEPDVGRAGGVFHQHYVCDGG